MYPFAVKEVAQAYLILKKKWDRVCKGVDFDLDEWLDWDKDKQTYLTQREEIERLKAMIDEYSKEMLPKGMRLARNQAFEEDAKLLDDNYSYCQDMRDTMCNTRIAKLAKEIRAKKEQS
jgi:hypothetical protein